MLKKIFKITGLILFMLIAGLAAFIFLTGPALPPQTEEVIEKVLQSGLPEHIKGDTGFAVTEDGIMIWYESRMPARSSKGTVLLIMGITTDAFGWPERFMQIFLDSGYQVIRHDHRGTGKSDWIREWKRSDPYTLKDMAADGVAILNHLGIDKAHIVGLSMGGMIGQELAIHYPDRTLSLTSIMSSGCIDDPDLPPVSKKVPLKMVRAGIRYASGRTERGLLRMHVAVRTILKGEADYDLDLEEITQRALYNIRNRGAYNPKAPIQHAAAIYASGSRYEGLKNLKIPTLIIHGTLDPFIPMEHGKKCAEVIPGAKSLWIEGLAHDLPKGLMDTMAVEVIRYFPN